VPGKYQQVRITAKWLLRHTSADRADFSFLTGETPSACFQAIGERQATRSQADFIASAPPSS
jgi:hypothetical protein